MAEFLETEKVEHKLAVFFFYTLSGYLGDDVWLSYQARNWEAVVIYLALGFIALSTALYFHVVSATKAYNLGYYRNGNLRAVSHKDENF